VTDLTQREADEPITIGEHELERPTGELKVTIQRQYIPPLDGTKDEVAAFDNWLARGVAELLVKFYYGYEWHVMAESRQGIIAFSIPDLMGPTLKQVIRLAEYKDLRPELIRETGGQMLERMGLRRGRMDRAEYEAAKFRRATFDFGDVKQ
jgi:hypothetical protein